jgi:hypothetical protein
MDLVLILSRGELVTHFEPAIYFANSPYPLYYAFDQLLV